MQLVVQAIVKKYQEKIPEIIKLNYGFEGWLQVELALDLAKRDEFKGVQIRREMAIYNKSPNSKCDLWIPGSDTRPNIGIELKTKGPTTDFVTAMVTDYTDRSQLSSAVGNNTQGLKREYVGAKGAAMPTTVMWGIGLTPDKNMADAVGARFKDLTTEARAAGIFDCGVVTLYEPALAGSSAYMPWWCQTF